MHTRTRWVALLAVVLLVTAACGDDGADVRSLGGSASSGSGSGSGSGTGHASGHASGSGSATGHASGVAGCNPVGEDLDGDETVPVTLDEWSVTLGEKTLPSGTIHFEIENTGEDAHEMAIARADSIEDLPLADDGTVALEEMGEDFIGEVEAFPAGETCSGTFELPAGEYVFLCNLIHEENGETENHFELGMRTEVTVR